MIHLFTEYMQRDIDIKKLWTDQPFEYDQRILQYHSKMCDRYDQKDMIRWGMQYADKI